MALRSDSRGPRESSRSRCCFAVALLPLRLLTGISVFAYYYIKYRGHCG